EALHCSVEPSIFHRKNYFYPDMPKDYQVSQYDMPINVRGWLELPDGTRVGITRAHMEEDTGKTTHVGGGGRIHEAGYALVDYNRAGVPLVEIVSDPDIRSADQAKAYVEELRGILAAIEVSDVKMEEGSIRVDSNVSMRPAGGSEFGTRCEIKNLNSLRSLVHAVEYEARRQIELLEAGERGRDVLVRAAIAAGADPDRVVTHAVHNLAVEGAANLDPDRVASLVKLETDGKLTATQAKKVLSEMLERGGDPASIAAELG